MANEAELTLIARIEATQRKFEKQMSNIAKSADTNFNKMSKRGRAYEKDMARSAANVKKLFVGAFAAMGGLSIGKSIFEVNKKFQDLESSLRTATGSVSGATKAFADIRNLAMKTPYSVAGLTESFVQLKNLGIEPTMKRMTAFGNISSAMNKSFKQMAEAVADAATGEFERLKEFGIKAKQQGDQVSLTFRGVTQTIGNNANEITNYLTRMGEAEFGGAMALKMQNLSGLTANLFDKMDNLYLKIGEIGANSAFAYAIQTAGDAVDMLANNLGNVGIAIASITSSIVVSLLPALARTATAMALFAISPFGAAIIGVGLLVGGLVTLYTKFSETASAADNLKNAQTLVAQSAVIAARAQNGLTVSLRNQGLEAASTAKELAHLAKQQANARLESISGRLDEFKIPDGSGRFQTGKHVGIQVSALKKQQAKIEEQWQLSSAKLSDAISNYDKISKAKIVASVDVDLKAPTIKLDGALKGASKSINSKVSQLFDSTRTPIEKLNIELKRLESLSRKGLLTNDLYKRGVDQAQTDYKDATKKPKEPKTGKGGGSGGGGGIDSAATAAIENHGSVLDRVQLATKNYNAEMAKVNRALREGKIDQETYNAAVANIEGVFEKAKNAAGDFGEVTKTIMDDVKSTLKGAFSDIRKGTFDLASTMDKLLGGIFDKVMGLALDGIFASFGFGGKAPIGKKDGGYIQAFANGGLVRGAGTGRSDSIPAVLSNKEFVVNANATAKHRGLLEQINNGNNIAFKQKQAVNQNVSVSQQPIVKMNITINNAPPNMQVSQNENGLEIDFLEQIEHGLAQRANEGQSSLVDAVRGAA